jgi:hypothetical protein
MTPKEKAIELVNSCNDLAKDFTRGVSMKEFSKQCALKAVNEILKEVYFPSQRNYFYEVKQNIQKL